MPLANQNLVITPNVGSSTDYPKMVFTASNTVTDTTITVRAYPTNNGTLSFEGSSGQLFSIANTMTGVIFAVNDISGLPSIQVTDTGLITLAGPGNGYVSVASNTPASSTATAALVVTGGVGIGGGLIVGGGTTSTTFNNVAITRPATTSTITLGSGTLVSLPASLTFPTTNATTATWVLAMSSTANTLQYQAPTTGPQGFQGVQGAQGFQGVQGAQGFQGVQGTVGAQGAQGVQGTVGAQGAQGGSGGPGSQGAQGVQGAQGFQGAQGVQGTVGAQGAQGGSGGPGSQGAQGFQGAQGVQGTVGAQGAQGGSGGPGSQGAQGVQGAQGFQGAQGVQGTVGAQGAQGGSGGPGSQGAQGVQGAQGFQGAQGVQGTVGAQGAQGVQGSSGGPGAQGAQGVQGSSGGPGAQGAQGVQGSSGGPGAQGAQGAQGSTAGTASNVFVASTLTNAAFYPTFVDANNVSATAEALYTTSSFAINPGSGNLGVGTATPASKLHVAGDARITGITTVTNTTPASSTSTGALQVAGGVGIGGKLYARDSINVSDAFASVTLNTNQLVFYYVGPSTISIANDLYITDITGNTTFVNFKQGGDTVYNSTTAASSTNTGALQVRGGVGVGGAVWANSVISINTVSNINNGANFVARPNGTTSSQRTGYSFWSTFANFPTDLGPRRSADIISGYATSAANPSGIWGGEYLSFNVGNNGSSNDGNLITVEQVRITSSSTIILRNVPASSTVTGALQVVGGAGIGGDLYVGGAVYTNGSQILTTSIQEFTATAGQTTFTIVGGYVVGQILVHANGVLLNSADYTASNGSTVVVNDARRVNDVIRIVVGQNNSVSLQQAYTFNQYTSNGTTTTFATIYNTATVQVFQNGILQMPTTYTANNGTSVIFGSIPTNGTSIGIISFNSVSITNAISSSGGTINGTLNVVGNLQINGTNVQNLATAMAVAMGI